MKRAVVLLSGGLDSATTLAIARKEGWENFALSFDYGQRHRAELECAAGQADRQLVTEHKVITMDLRQFGASALTADIGVPKGRDVSMMTEEIPITYVPARNTLFLSYALAWAEVLGASDIFIGVTSVDYSGYPDCRPEYISAFEVMANLATKRAIDGHRTTIHAPLIAMSKFEIIQTGLQLGVDYSLSSSCYDPLQNGAPCRQCDSCTLREKGFLAHELTDPRVVKFESAHC